MPCKLTESPKNISTAFQPCHKRTSSNNRLEASKRGWCLESLFFLCQPWLPAWKHMPSSLLCTKRASQARISLAVRLHHLSDHQDLQGERFNCCEGFRAPKKVQQALGPLIQLRDRGTTSRELAQEWQQAGVSASACTVSRGRPINRNG